MWTPRAVICVAAVTHGISPSFLVIGPANWSNSAENLPEIVKMSTSPEYYSVCLIPCSFLRSQNGGIPEELFRHGSFLSFNNHRNPDRSQIRMFCVKFLVHRCLWLLTYILTIWSDRGVLFFLKWKCTHHITSCSSTWIPIVSFLSQHDENRVHWNRMGMRRNQMEWDLKR